MDMEIKGISCDVENCKYHDKTNNCNAGHIKVGNSNATSSTDTKCETLNAATAAVVAKINQNNGSVKRRAVI